MGFWKDVGSFIGGAAGGNIIGAGIGALGSIIGGKFTNDANLGMMREQMAWNTKEREASQSYNTRERVSSQEWQDQQRRLQNNWARDMYEAYQTPQALAEQYKAAGLNPRLAMGSNSVGNVSASSGSTGGAPSGTHVSPMGASVPYMSSQGYTSAFGDIANALKSLGEAKKAGVETEQYEKSFKARMKQLELSNEAQELLNTVNFKYLDKKERLILDKFAQELETGKLNQKEIIARVRNLGKQGILLQKDVDTYEIKLYSQLAEQVARTDNFSANTARTLNAINLDSANILYVKAQTEYTQALKESEINHNRAMTDSITNMNNSLTALNKLAKEIREAGKDKEIDSLNARFDAEYQKACAEYNEFVNKSDYTNTSSVRGAFLGYARYAGEILDELNPFSR